MVNQATWLDRLEDWLGECGGMLRRRIPAGTVAQVLAASAALVALGGDALARGDATLLLGGLVLVFAAAAARRRLR